VAGNNLVNLLIPFIGVKIRRFEKPETTKRDLKPGHEEGKKELYI